MKTNLSTLCLLSGTLLGTLGCSGHNNQEPVALHASEEPSGCSEEQRGCQKENFQLANVSASNILYQEPKISKIQKIKRHKLTTVEGKTIEIIERQNGFVFPQYPDKVVILELFGKHCQHCLHEIPTLNRLHQRYGKRLEIIAIQVEDPMGQKFAQNFIQKHRIRYPVVDGESSLDLQNTIQTQYEWRGILPYTLVIHNNTTEYAYSGSVSYKELSNDLQAIIPSKSTSRRLATSKL